MRRHAIARFGLVVVVALACGCPGGGGADGDGDATDGPTSGATSGTDATMGTLDSTADDGSGTDDGGEPDPGEVVECPDHPLSPPAAGTCEVTSAGSAGLLLRGTVLTPGGILRAGQVLVDATGVISCVDCDCSGTPGFDDATEIACGDAVISPGLVNAHDHIEFANNAPIGEGPERYEHRHDWRTGAGGHQEIDTNGGASTEVVRAAELRFVMGGATSIVGVGGAPGLVRNLDIGGHLEGLALPLADSDTFPLDDASGTQLEQGCNYGGEPTTHADIADENAYLPHIAEGIDLAARNEFLCTSEGATDLIEPQTAVVHGVGLVAQDYAVLREAGTALVWSPRSNIVLYGNTASVTAMHRMGVPIALGTDWVPSGSINLQRELACADAFNRDYLAGYFSDRDLWKMVTTNAAFAVGAEGLLGTLAPGAAGDIAVFQARADATDHRAVVQSNVEHVALVLRGGVPLYGDDALLSAIGAGDCEPLDVCGSQKRACVAQDTGGDTTLAQARGAIEAFYPMFFCGVPDDEPSCVPWRPDDFPNGITATDADGDGLDDGVDNCPSVFNPVRWLEQSQADADGDQAGDACDPCPLDPGDGCDPPDADDADGDGIENGLDNCPFQTNPGQADADSDGHGDDCDDCALSNPGAAPCTSSIVAIRDPGHPDHPAEGSVVAFSGGWVTGIRPDTGSNRGFYVQEDSLDPYSGLFVFTGTQSPGVEVGNRVAVVGVYEEYFGLTEVSSSSVTIEDAGTELPFSPIVVPPADVATGGMLAESYEAMLVMVEDVTITDPNPDGAEDFDELAVTDALRIDDELADTLGNDCPAGAGFSSIIGVLGFSFANNKLLPRDAADVVFTDCDPFMP